MLFHLQYLFQLFVWHACKVAVCRKAVPWIAKRADHYNYQYTIVINMVTVTWWRILSCHVSCIDIDKSLLLFHYIHIFYFDGNYFWHISKQPNSHFFQPWELKLKDLTTNVLLYVISCRIMSCLVVSCHDISCHVILCHVKQTWHDVMLVNWRQS